MREIKFRVWDKKYRQMHFGGDIRIALVCPADDLEIMQYTGLKDKNGKEIYEGDIVRLGNNIVHEGALARCFWSEKTARFLYELLVGDNKGKCTDMVGDWRTHEVIGNIYENPELVNQCTKTTT